MLAAGEIDCAIIARPPTCFLEGHPDVVRLFPDYLEMEEKYYKRTKVWPIMHIIAMKKAIVLTRTPGCRATSTTRSSNRRAAAIERLLDPAVSRYPRALAADLRAEACATCSAAITFPYGIEENRADLGADAALHLSAGHRASARQAG